jgi:hypothetical protein
VTRTFWPPGEAAQVDYERLREAALDGVGLVGPAAVRFARGGLAALIAHPTAEPGFVAALVGAVRPPWTPQLDPRRQALAAGYELVLAAAGAVDVVDEVAW